MKGVTVIKMRVLSAIFLLSLYPMAATALISGSAHDFSTEGWSGNKICEPCHTPHNADGSVADAPLWNHEVTSAIYNLYSSPTLDAPIGQPGGLSKLCLSCHDGTVALDAFGGNTGSISIGPPELLGTDLRDDHPIGILWTHQTLDGGDCTRCHFSMPLPFFGPSGNKTIECATCHDVHNDVSENYLLRESMAGSQLCLVCHQDKE
jgi:predicted CXXCH cytochrome family protein